MPRLELALALLRYHVCDDLHRVRFRRLFVDEYNLSCTILSLVRQEDFAEVVNVAIKHLKVDSVLWRVDCEGTNGQTSDCRDIARLSTLSLDDKDSSS
jgi:hypothetical protein